MVDIIKHFIDDASQLKVAVIGDTITDEFVYVTYEGQSMKSICPVFRLAGKHEIQAGGAAAIANHLRDFVRKVDLFSNEPSEIVKTRYLDINDKKKHVEINKFNINTNTSSSIQLNLNNYDVVIVADFGHGVCDDINLSDGFHLMCQTNSNNFGFNRISKWKKYRKKSVCIDLREASLQMNKKATFATEEEVNELYQYELNSENLFVTIGSKGSLFYNGQSLVRHPAFKSEIVDTIGAGDTFFAFASLVTHIYNNQISKQLLIPSLAASLSTTWLCNENSVTKKTLLEYANKFV